MFCLEQFQVRTRVFVMGIKITLMMTPSVMLLLYNASTFLKLNEQF